MALQQDILLHRFGYKQELRRSLGFGDMLYYGLLYMVPIAPFGLFGSIYSASGGMVALTYIVATIALLFTASSYAQMARAYPMVGSVYSYAGRAIAPPVGFLSGWMMMLDYTLIPLVCYLAASLAMHSMIPVLPVWGWLIAFVTVNTVINCLGIKLTALIIRITLTGEIVVLAVVLSAGVTALLQGRPHAPLLAPLYNPHLFSWPLVFTGVSVVVVTFLGFDAIALLAEENRGNPNQVGRSMISALLLIGVLFMAQVWIISLFVPDPAALLKGDPAGTSFYDAARVAGGPWLATLTAASLALSFGFPTTMVMQTANSRLLYAMARDRQLPSLLAKVSMKRLVPTNAVLATAFVMLALGLYLASLPDAITLLSTLVDFGALSGFLMLHVSVIAHYMIRKRSRRYVRHLLSPLIGFAILLYVMVNSNIASQILGFGWLALGLLTVLVLYLAGRRPRLPGLLAVEDTV